MHSDWLQEYGTVAKMIAVQTGAPDGLRLKIICITVKNPARVMTLLFR